MSRLKAVMMAAAIGIGWLAPEIASGSDLIIRPGGKLIVNGQVTVTGGNLVMDSTSEVQIDLAGKITADSAGYDGTLTVTDTGNVAAGGGQYELFTASTYTGTFVTETLPTVSAGLAWENTLTTDGTISLNSVGAPGVDTLAATLIKSTSVQINGSVQPNNLATTYQFEYGLDNSYGTTLPLGSLSAGDVAQSVNELISGLSPKTTYHYRLSATNSSGTTSGQDLTFTTSMIPEMYSAVHEFSPDNQMRMGVRGDPGVTYQIETSTNLSQWVFYQNATADANGEFEFTCPVSSGTPRQFFRVLYD